MQFDPKFRPEAVCSTDPTRFALNHVYLVGSRLYASDGVSAVRIPITRDETDVDGAIPVAALEDARKQALRGRLASIQCLEGHCIAPNGARYDRPVSTVNIPLCVDPFFDGDVQPVASENLFLDFRLLERISKAIGGASGMKFERSGEAVVITAIRSDGKASKAMSGTTYQRIAVLMAIRGE